jgi:hypothetical protein
MEGFRAELEKINSLRRNDEFDGSSDGGTR